MSTTWNLLLQHRAELIDQLEAARQRAEAPYIAELESTNRALEALRGAPTENRATVELCEKPSTKSFKASGSRGRKKRSLREMVEIALKTQQGPVDVTVLMSALEQRWNRTFQQGSVELELLRIQQEVAVNYDTEADWRETPRASLSQASSSMSQ